MKIIISLMLIIALVKTTVFYINLKIKSAKKKTYSAEELIKCGYMNPEDFKRRERIYERMVFQDISKTEMEAIEEEYIFIKSLFKSVLKAKDPKPEKIAHLEVYLREVLGEKKTYNNNAHAIYSMLKSPKLSLNHFEKIKNILDTTQDKQSI